MANKKRALWRNLLVSALFLFGAGSVCHAQSTVPDSVVTDTEEVTVKAEAAKTSIDSLNNELSLLKSQISALDNEAKYEKIWKRRRYWRFGLANPNIERTDGESMTWKTDLSVFVQQGKTAYFHKKPIAGMIKIGLDYGFFEVGYSKLKLKSVGATVGSSSSNGAAADDGFTEIESNDPVVSLSSLIGVDLGMHKIDYSMHIGPRISVNPWNSIIVSAYCHVKPTASGIIENEKVSYGFGCVTTAGLSVSYKLISVGVEGVWSKIKYTQKDFDEESIGSENDGNIFSTKKFKLKQSGPRFFIAFKF